MVRQWLIGIVLAVVALPVQARVIASIDRALIDANESFNLSISVDNMLSDEPDVSALADNFDVLGAQESNNTRIYNGEITQQRLFTFQLMPKRAGVLDIPPIRVGREASQPLSITVRAADTTSAAGRDIFIEVALDRESTWVQAEVILNLRVYRAALVRQEQLREPAFDGPEVLVQRLGDDRSFTKQIGDRSYDVYERRYAIYPQSSGTLDIGEFVYSGRIWQRSRLSSRRLFRSEPLSIEVQPIPPPPVAFPDASWLPASDIELTQRWNPDASRAVAGEPVTRAITLRATGLMAAQLPPLEPDIDAAVRVYPDQPELETQQAENGLIGIRTERYAVIAAAPGNYVAPAVQLPWWDVDESRWVVAELPATALVVAPGAADPGLTPPAAAGDGAADTATATPASVRQWQFAAGGATLLWLATVVAWALTRRRGPSGKARLKTDPTRLGARRQQLKLAVAAARSSEFDVAGRHLREWAALEFGGGPWSLSAIAARLDGPAAVAVNALNKALYGPGTTPPPADALARAISSLSKLPAAPRADRTAGALAPLSPLTGKPPQ